MDKWEKAEKERYEKAGITFATHCDTTFEGKFYKKGSILPWEARNCSASIQVKKTIDNKIEPEKKFDWENTTSKRKLDKYAETLGLKLDGRKSIESMKEEIEKYLKR